MQTSCSLNRTPRKTPATSLQGAVTVAQVTCCGQFGAISLFVAYTGFLWRGGCITSAFYVLSRWTYFVASIQGGERRSCYIVKKWNLLKDETEPMWVPSATYTPQSPTFTSKTRLIPTDSATIYSTRGWDDVNKIVTPQSGGLYKESSLHPQF